MICVAIGFYDAAVTAAHRHSIPSSKCRVQIGCPTIRVACRILFEHLQQGAREIPAKFPGYFFRERGCFFLGFEGVDELFDPHPFALKTSTQQTLLRLIFVLLLNFSCTVNQMSGKSMFGCSEKGWIPQGVSLQ